LLLVVSTQTIIANILNGEEELLDKA
jgi:hypothetical protein